MTNSLSFYYLVLPIQTLPISWLWKALQSSVPNCLSFQSILTITASEFWQHYCFLFENIIIIPPKCYANSWARSLPVGFFFFLNPIRTMLVSLDTAKLFSNENNCLIVHFREHFYYVFYLEPLRFRKPVNPRFFWDFASI